jgi:hypothetical protein
MPSIETVLQVANVSALGLIVWCFVSGHIVSRKLLDEIIASTVQNVLEQLGYRQGKDA